MMTLVFCFVLSYFGLVKFVFIVDWRFNDFKVVNERYLSLVDIFNLSGVKFDIQTNTFGTYIILGEEFLLLTELSNDIRIL